MAKYSIDHPFFVLMGNIGDWILLNIVFVLTSLPVVTIGISLTAMYQVALRKRRGESNYVVREYLKAWKAEAKQGIKTGLLFLVSGAILLFDVLYARNFGSLFAVTIGCLVVIWAFVFSYAFPLQARFQNTVKNTLQNAFLLALKYLPFTVIMVVLNSIPFLCIAAGAVVTAMALPIYFFFGFALTAKINVYFLDKIFQKLIEQREMEEKTE